MEKQIKLPAEIEIHSAKVEGRRIYVDYTIYDGDGLANVTQEFKVYDLIEFIKTNEMNIGEFITSDQGIDNFYFDPATFLFENLESIVKLYITSKLEEVAS